MSGINEQLFMTNLADAVSAVLERRGMKPIEADETAREITESVARGIRVSDVARLDRDPIARNTSRLVDYYKPWR